MNGSAELQVAAQTNSHVVYSAFELMNGHQVGQCLSWVLMAAIACVDNRNWGVHCSNHWCAFFWVTHCSNISIACDNTDGISNAFAFCSGRRISGRESDNVAAQFHHGRFKAESGAGAWFIEEGCKLFAFTNFRIFLRVFDDVVADL